MAVGLERAHAEFLGQGEGLLVVGFGRLDLRGLALRRNVAEEAQGIRLVAPFLVLTGERQRRSARACASSRRPASSCASPRARRQSA